MIYRNSDFLFLKVINHINLMCCVAGSLGLNSGLQLEKAAVVALVRNIDIPVAYLFDVCILHHDFSMVSIIGGMVIIVAIGGKHDLWKIVLGFMTILPIFGLKTTPFLGLLYLCCTLYSL